MHTNVVSQRPQAWLSELEVDKLIGVLGLAKRSSTTEIPTLTTATVLSEGTLITDWNGLQVSPRF